MAEPRALTADELRDLLLDYARDMVDYWDSTNRESEMSVRDRIGGAVFSVLCALDGVTPSLPCFDLVAQPHESDKQYCIDNGENWIEPGTVISDMLHEHFHKPTK